MKKIIILSHDDHSDGALHELAGHYAEAASAQGHEVELHSSHDDGTDERFAESLKNADHVVLFHDDQNGTAPHKLLKVLHRAIVQHDQYPAHTKGWRRHFSLHTRPHHGKTAHVVTTSTPRNNQMRADRKETPVTVRTILHPAGFSVTHSDLGARGLTPEYKRHTWRDYVRDLGREGK